MLKWLLPFWALGVLVAQDSPSVVTQTPVVNIGPSVMSGRVTDLAVNPDAPHEFYVAYASGGLWYTQNNGTSFSPVMDNSPTQNIGDIAVDWINHTIWVGTGENNASRSSYAGIGLLKSKDKGQTWEHMGLEDAHHFGKIEINPNNPNEVVVGVTGHLYTPNSQRGIFKTRDGGKTWAHTLYINDTTGIIDITVAPEDFNVMYAAAWQKDRKAWHFTGSGSASGIYKSTDAGNSWTLISTSDSGFPQGEGVGRIGLAAFDTNNLYAILDNQDRRPAEKKSMQGLQKNDFKTLSLEGFFAINDSLLEDYLRANRFPKKYTAQSVKASVKLGKVQPADLALYLEDANAQLFDTPVIGAEVYRSKDGGNSWNKTHDDFLDDIYFSYGYYFGQIHVSPTDKEAIYIYGVPFLKSKDGGQTFTDINAPNAHVDHHALWINPDNPNHLINGNDGGVNISYDDGAHWIKNNQPSVGQFYTVYADRQDPYHVYGGLQDNGVWVAPHTATESPAWHQTGHNNWTSIMGGDGMQIQVDSRNPEMVFTGFQFGNYFRIDRAKNKRTYIQPKHELGESPLRFNWQTPILLSPHNQDILYLGSNKLHRSMNQGDDWTSLSGDLTQGGIKGNVPYGTITALDESTAAFGIIVVGTDDGHIQLTQDGGTTWERISDPLPQNLWVSRVQFSKHAPKRIYATLNGYRNDDFQPYVYVSQDMGKSWQPLHHDLPMSPVNVIKEDPTHPKILYLGTDNAAYVSINAGTNWHAFADALPKVAVHDMVIQPDKNHLLLGTHGRSIYKVNLEHIQQLPELSGSSLHLFAPKDVDYSSRWGMARNVWSEPPTPEMTYVVYSALEKSVDMHVKSDDDVEVFLTTIDLHTGLNYMTYDLSVQEENLRKFMRKHKELKQADNGIFYLPKGNYSLQLEDVVKKFKIK
ncbi:MAG: WD40/YVTN/BNR-like repeat-containing protein [Flavobacteriaceae bacterium]